IKEVEHAATVSRPGGATEPDPPGDRAVANLPRLRPGVAEETGERAGADAGGDEGEHGADGSAGDGAGRRDAAEGGRAAGGGEGGQRGQGAAPPGRAVGGLAGAERGRHPTAGSQPAAAGAAEAAWEASLPLSALPQLCGGCYTEAEPPPGTRHD